MISGKSRTSTEAFVAASTNRTASIRSIPFAKGRNLSSPLKQDPGTSVLFASCQKMMIYDEEHLPYSHFVAQADDLHRVLTCTFLHCIKEILVNDSFRNRSVSPPSCR